MSGPSEVTVLAWGIAGSLQHTGRQGRAALGAPRGGALDRASLELANRLVGNPPDAAGFETSGGLVVATRHPVLVALTGAIADVEVDRGPGVGWGVPVVLAAGVRLRIGRLRDGARSYLAVRGGLARGADPATVTVGPDPGAPAASHAAARPELRRTVRVWPGPRRDWFAAGAWEVLVSSEYHVGPDSNRVGARLDGPPLERAVSRELPSEGLVEGAVQVPPDGRPIVMLADHPTTGGYPVIGVVDPDDVGQVAQRGPGDVLRFTAAARRHR